MDVTVPLPHTVKLYKYYEKRRNVLKKYKLIQIKKFKVKPNFILRKPVFKVLNKPNYLPIKCRGKGLVVKILSVSV